MPLEFFRIGPVVSETRGGARNSPPSGARYKNTPVGRGLKVKGHFEVTSYLWLIC